MGDALGCSTRSFTVAGLLGYGVTVAFLALAVKFPRVGAPPIAHGESFRLPPLYFRIFLSGVSTVWVFVMVGLVCIRYSLASRQWAWVSVFLVFSVLGLLGPALLMLTQLHAHTGGVAAVISALGIVLTLLASLLYSIHSPSA